MNLSIFIPYNGFLRCCYPLFHIRFHRLSTHLSTHEKKVSGIVLPLTSYSLLTTHLLDELAADTLVICIDGMSHVEA